MKFLDEIRRRQSPEQGLALFENARQSVLDEPEKRARKAIREAALTVARTWERLPSGWPKKAASRGISSDPVLLKAEGKVSEQLCLLTGLQDPVKHQAEIELIVTRILDGASFWHLRAMQVIQSQRKKGETGK